MEAKHPDARAFAMPRPNRIAKMLREDLAAARAAWLDEVRTAQERAERERSDFLAYRDSAGRVCDFHSLRHTTGSLLAASGVHPKTAQAVMRHSTIALTMDRYTHSLQHAERDAVAALPRFEMIGGKNVARRTQMARFGRAGRRARLAAKLTKTTLRSPRRGAV